MSQLKLWCWQKEVYLNSSVITIHSSVVLHSYHYDQFVTEMWNSLSYLDSSWAGVTCTATWRRLAQWHICYWWCYWEFESWNCLPVWVSVHHRCVWCVYMYTWHNHKLVQFVANRVIIIKFSTINVNELRFRAIIIMILWIIPSTRSAKTPPRRPETWLSPMMILTEAVPRPTSMLPKHTYRKRAK